MLETAASAGRAEDEGWRVRKDGSRLWASVVVTALREPRTGDLLGFVKVTRDLTERKRSADKTAASLAEKTALLQEIHHRVKNNLQMIASLLKLQARRITDEGRAPSSWRPRGACTRLPSCTRVSTSRTTSGASTCGSTSSASSRICGRRIALAPASSRRWPTSVSPVDVAIPCGLIINELVTNALKHAFRDAGGRAENEIRVDVVRQGTAVALSVSDNGHGLSGDVDPLHEKTMGLSLVRDLGAQLGGEAKFESDGGVRCTVTFQARTTGSPDA